MSDYQKKIRLYGFLWVVSTMGVFGGHGVNLTFTLGPLNINLMFIISLVVIWLLNKLKVVHISAAIIWSVFFACFVLSIFLDLILSTVTILTLVALSFYVVWNCFSAIAKKRVTIQNPIGS